MCKRADGHIYTSYYVMKLMITKSYYKKSSRGIDVSALLNVGISHPINRPHYFKFEVVTFCSQNRKIFQECKVVSK